MKVISILGLLTGSLLLGACGASSSGEDQGKVLAEVHGHQLRESDLTDLKDMDYSGAVDSLAARKNYLERWIREEVLLYQALQDTGINLDEINAMTEAYKRSLILFNYRERLNRTFADTLVTDADIETYYNRHQGNFELKKNIVQLDFVKFYRNDPALNQAKKLFRSTKTEDQISLLDLCRKSAVNYYFNDSSWLFFDEVLKEVPIVTYNEEAFLQSNKVVELDDNEFSYLVQIHDFRIKNSLSPLSLEKENIRTILLKQKQMEQLSAREKALIEEARLKGAIIINEP